MAETHRDEQGASSGLERARVVSESDLFDRIEDEIERCKRYERVAAVACLIPLLVPGEAFARRELEAALGTASQLLRSCDIVAPLGGDGILAILPETVLDTARIAAHRVAAELTRRSGSIQQRKWRSGLVSVPLGGDDPLSLVAEAMSSAGRAPRA